MGEWKKMDIEKSVAELEKQLEENRIKRIKLKKERQINNQLKSETLLEVWTTFKKEQEEEKIKLRNLEESLLTLEKNINQIDRFCGDYQLMWKIRGFSQLFEDAKNETRTALQSPQFDSHRNGYKLQLTLFPYGDGYAIGSAMSLYVSIMKGGCDFLLRWPFSCPVTFTLVNQADSEHQDHSLTYSPQEDTNNLLHLTRPTTEKNRAIGFKKFANIEDVFEKGFITNDTIFIKVIVDLSNL